MIAAKHCIWIKVSQEPSFISLFFSGIRKTAYADRTSVRYGYALDVDGKQVILNMGMLAATHRYDFRAHGTTLACAFLALIPMTCALAGVAIDEYRHLGFSTWLSACRASDWSLGSLVVFTFELLPSGVIGLLAGGLLVQSLGILLRHRGCAPRAALSAHGGCVLGMAAGMLLCTWVQPTPWMVAAEAIFAALAAAWLFSRSRRHAAVASVKLPSGTAANAQ